MSTIKIVNEDTLQISKADFKEIWGTLMDFDLERILEEAEECSPQAVQKARKLSKLAYSK